MCAFKILFRSLTNRFAMLDSADLSFDELRRIDRICDDFEQQISDGRHPSIESILQQEEDLSIREFMLAQLVAAEIEASGNGFNHESFSTYSNRFPEYCVAIESVFRAQHLTNLVEDLEKTINSEKFEDLGMRLNPGSRFNKYQIISCIGSGTFGVVYHAYDTELERDVALKLSRFAESENVRKRFIEEAKSAAQINTSGVATIYDLFIDQDRVCIVQEFVDGFSLKQLIAYKRLTVDRSVRLVMEIAKAISGAHKQGIFHRDLKPGNIMISRAGKPMLVDFGLALRADRSGDKRALIGTPSYMSPEQVRGESNRTDPTTDIWALGVVLYELLTAILPFDQSDQEQLFEAIQTKEPIPVTDLAPTISNELNRITLKCLSKRRKDRYRDAKTLVRDLNRYLNKEAGEAIAEEFIEFVPRGLRSFDAEDHAFYLPLVPGPRDHRGVPESISFWSRKIENFDRLETFSVGVIYGRSGCGKSSFVKAGLLPLLSSPIRTIYFEANQFETELRMFHKLRGMFPEIPENMSLPETVAALRDGDYLERGEKLVIVIDQFEQWLSQFDDSSESQLGDALRHCDGVCLQVLLVIREDYWPQTSRFLERIEVPVAQNQNCRSLDLFDRAHALRLLFEIGKAHQRFAGEIPSREETGFLTKVVSDLAENNKVLGIQLAMFSEAFKDKAWTLESLGEFGGADGVGVSFLNETFVLPQASAAYRTHKKAAQKCLQQLLPAIGSDLKGHMRSLTELMEASGYVNEPASFDRLVDILEQDLKMITSVEPIRSQYEGGNQTAPHSEPHFQLSHDYLVPIIRRWISIEDQRHLQGRVEARMAEVTQIWGDAKHNRYLPTWWETLNITLFSRWHRWTDLQGQMMAASFRKHAITSMVALFVISTCGFLGYCYWQNRIIVEQVELIKTSLVSNLDENLDSLQSWRSGLVPEIQQEIGRLKSITPASREHQQLIGVQNFKMSIALARLNDSNWEDVAQGFQFVPKDEVLWLAEFLRTRQEDFKPGFKKELTENFDSENQVLFRKAIAMAVWGDPSSLARFMVHRDVHQSQALLTRLDRAGIDVSVALQDLVDELRASVMADPSDELVQMAGQYSGTVNGSSGTMLKIPITEISRVLESLYHENYAPQSIRPYYFEHGKYAAITFQRHEKLTGRNFESAIQWDTFASKGRLQQKQLELTDQGWKIIDISCCMDSMGEQPIEFSALWLYLPNLETRLELDSTDKMLRRSISRNAEDGFQIERMFSRASDKGVPLHSLIWSKKEDSEMVGADFLRQSVTAYLCDSKQNLRNSDIADCQMMPVNLTLPDRFRLNQELSRFDNYTERYLDSDFPISTLQTAESINDFAGLLARSGQVEQAYRAFEKLIDYNPWWWDRSLEYLNFLSRVPDKNGFNAEYQRLLKLGDKLTKSQRIARIPIAQLRLHGLLGESQQAQKLYESIETSFNELEVELKQSGKTDSLNYLLNCRLRLAAVYSMIAENGEQILEEAAEKFDQLGSQDAGFIIVDPDFDRFRSYPPYQEFISRNKFGLRVAKSWRADPYVSTQLDSGDSFEKLLASVRMSMASGFRPKTVSCQPTIDHQEISGRVVSEKPANDEAVLQKKIDQLAQAARLLDSLGQPELKIEIETGKFGSRARMHYRETK